MADIEDQETDRIAALAERLRASGSLGKSDVMNRLFDFLLMQSLAGRSPKEFEVAQEVFGKGSEFDMAQDASVRVYIHRLRRKLEEVPVAPDGARLTVPRGEYRLAIELPGTAVPAVDVPEEEEAPPPVSRTPSRRTIAALVGALILGILISTAFWMVRGPSIPVSPLAGTSFWKPLVAAPRLTVVVVGDYYIFGEASEGGQVNRLIREFSINSREDLDAYMMEYPAVMGRYVDLDLHYLPTSIGPALSDVLPVADGFTVAAGGGHARIMTMSRLTPEFLKRGNIVYVGFLSSLGLLREPVFKASGFAIGASYDELIDKATNKHYVSNSDAVANTHAPRRDYAYLASFPGPSGNRILIVAGTRDAAVMQAAEVAADKAQLEQIAARSGNADSFEALYEVSTLGPLNVGFNLVVARPIKTDGLWTSGSAIEAFPDVMPDPARNLPRPGTANANPK